jgi:hypothetical protein
MSKKVAILQSNYIPWKGYFDLINMVDLFIFHDDLQYTHGDWRNRNKIKTSNGLEWLTVPCGKSNKRLINEVILQDHKWQQKHWIRIKQNYGKTKYFSQYESYFKEIYLNTNFINLSEMNQYIIKAISKDILNISTKFEDSKKYNLQYKSSERVLELLKIVNADIYLSGPAGKDYLINELFVYNNIKIEWMDYNGYKEYKQMFEPFEHGVSILDLIFNEGPNAKKFMKSFKE